MKTCFLVVAAIVAHVSMVTGCSCVPSDHQAKYCQSDYVVIARVIDLTYEEGDRIYNVDVQYVYKGNVTKGRVKVRTTASGSMCGVSLRENAVYLLNGEFFKRQMWISSCGTISFYPVNHPNTFFMFNPYYDCRCKVKNILLGEKDKKPKWVCALGNAIQCPPEFGTMAECRYDKDKDDCDWAC
ncbi:metalloproteinase inhibitor 3-like [Ostrea edulis]|uniref:metalloproteinase inhibitor 3-like n=1 Tax=Ostrea edulis TaxID=37623 RepID=UPI0020945B1E|nr:metalloproteinase inhibitor 3-like [Ostrea edulis]